MQAAHTVWIYASPIPSEMQRLLNWTLITCWKVSLLFSPEDTASVIWTRLTIEHFSTLKQSILNEPWPTGHDGVSGPCTHMASFLHDRDLVGICRWHGFLEVFLGLFSDVNDRIMPMSDAVSSEGPKTTGIQQRSSALSLTHRDFSSFSVSFDDVMHCRWWDLQSLCNLTLRNVDFKVFHNRFTHSFTGWRASAHLYFWETLPLLDIPFIANHVTDLMSINLISS